MISELDLQIGLFIAIGLLLVVAARWLKMLFVSRIETRYRRMSSPEIKRPSPSHLDTVPIVVAPSPIKVERDMNEVDSMLEEAELYANHGRPATAVKILQEVIKLHPSKAAAWLLLLSSYSSLGKAVEFEETAGEFLKHHKNNPLWSSVQALGRTFDRNNSLYVDSKGSIFASHILSNATPSRRSVGDILIEMGALTEEALQRCLDDFDRKKHGHLGGYLLARKEITIAQLDQALLLQQTSLGKVRSPGNLAVPVCDDSSQLRTICGY